ncbi:MAG: alpha/beta hydrolase [Chitinophagaceae bacterium]
MKFLKWLGIVLLVLIIIYFFGPKPSSPKYTLDLPAVPADAASLEQYVNNGEKQHKIKENNEARIIWQNDSLKQKTEYAVVYLHGFSASQEEGDPVHRLFAKNFGCNLYLSRLAEHGIDTTEPLLNYTADGAWNTAKEAFAIGKQLGKKVIIIGCSTGGTLALKLAADYPNDIAGLILLSPNIAINDPNAWVLNNHWGLQVAHMVKGTYNISTDTTLLYKQYWNSKYRMEATVQLEELLETTMKSSLFEEIKQPTLLMYYYKDEVHQDSTVKVSAMRRMFRQLGTPPELKREIAVPNAGDHVISSYITSKDLKTVEDGCEKFALEILKMPLVQQPMDSMISKK